MNAVILDVIDDEIYILITHSELRTMQDIRIFSDDFIIEYRYDCSIEHIVQHFYCR